MTRFTCDSGTSYRTGDHTFELTSDQIRGAAVVLVISRTGRYRWANPTKANVSAFQAADYFEQIAKHIRTDADCILEHAGEVEMDGPLGEHLDATRRRERTYTVGLMTMLAVVLLAAWLSGWDPAVIIASAVIASLAIFLGWRTWRIDVHEAAAETDRLLDEQARDGGTDV